MIYTLDEIKKRILPVIEKYSIPAMYLFGSYARGDFNIQSELDIMILVHSADSEIKKYENKWMEKIYN